MRLQTVPYVTVSTCVRVDEADEEGDTSDTGETWVGEISDMWVHGYRVSSVGVSGVESSCVCVYVMVSCRQGVCEYVTVRAAAAVHASWLAASASPSAFSSTA